ncbi:flagellar protein FlaG [Vallitalea longa]|uniref:Flagellar protein FlaG n=1 Tax=Vallitalea longa TaxID=2936439 RepID=A0A9W5Y7Q0_9FIRM|nr:flagellar protein FlaG [Vallitalea longa]GKX28477.1 flagellar protein FlaG [Vallitalea longa]
MMIKSNGMELYSSNPQVEVNKKEVVQNLNKTTNSNKTIVEKNIDVEINNQNKDHEVIEAIEKANKKFKTYNRRLEFSIHEKTKQILVKVIDTEDDSVIREIPSEKILDMVAKLWEMSGIFVDEKR